MTDLVSNQWIRTVALAAVTAVGCAILIPYGFPWTGLLWVSLAFSAALWLGRGVPRSMAQVIDDVEAEAVPAVARQGGAVRRRLPGAARDKETCR